MMILFSCFGAFVEGGIVKVTQPCVFFHASVIFTFDVFESYFSRSIFVILEKRGKGCVLDHEQKRERPFPLYRNTYILSYIGREGYKVSE